MAEAEGAAYKIFRATTLEQMRLVWVVQATS